MSFSLDRLISRAGLRVTCDCCGEEIINEREVVRLGKTLCKACAGEPYYERLDTVTKYDKATWREPG